MVRAVHQPRGYPHALEQQADAKGQAQQQQRPPPAHALRAVQQGKAEGQQSQQLGEETRVRPAQRNVHREQGVDNEQYDDDPSHDVILSYKAGLCIAGAARKNRLAIACPPGDKSPG